MAQPLYNAESRASFAPPLTLLPDYSAETPDAAPLHDESTQVPGFGRDQPVTFTVGNVFHPQSSYLADRKKEAKDQRDAAEADRLAEQQALLAARQTPKAERERLAREAILAARATRSAPTGWLRRLGFCH